MKLGTLRKILPLMALAAALTVILVATTTTAQAEGAQGTAAGSVLGKAVGAGLAVGLAGIGAGYAIGVAGASGLSALTEKPEMLSQVLLVVALGEGVAIYGLLIAILVLFTL